MKLLVLPLMGVLAVIMISGCTTGSLAFQNGTPIDSLYDQYSNQTGHSDKPVPTVDSASNHNDTINNTAILSLPAPECPSLKSGYAFSRIDSYIPGLNDSNSTSYLLVIPNNASFDREFSIDIAATGSKGNNTVLNCALGKSVGQNVNYFYCQTFYIVKRVVSQSGDILRDERWKITPAVDIRNANYETKPWNYYNQILGTETDYTGVKGVSWDCQNITYVA